MIDERRALIVAVPDATFQKRPREGAQIASCDECERQVWLAPSSVSQRDQLEADGLVVDVRCPVCTVTMDLEYKEFHVNSKMLAKAIESLEAVHGAEASQSRALIMLAVQQYRDEKRRRES